MQANTAQPRPSPQPLKLVGVSLGPQWCGVLRHRDQAVIGPSERDDAPLLFLGLLPMWGGCRRPDGLVREFLREIDPLLPRAYGTYRDADKHIANILVGLGRNNPAHRAAVAERIATVFEDADDLAEIIVDAAASLSESLTLIKPRLHALLRPEPGLRQAQTRNAARALVEIGDRSPELLTVADSAVAVQLATDVAYTANSVRHVAGVEEIAILAACLSVERRTELAHHYCARMLDTNDTEGNRATYASACRIAAENLPADVRNELFDRLFALRAPTDNKSSFDAISRHFEDPFGFLRIQTRPGQLRRQVAKTLAVLATDNQRRERVWKTAQQLAVSGEFIDANTVGYVGYTLAAKGYAPRLPWDTMACSSDSELRRLAAALIPFIPDVDPELITNLARDPQMLVPRELAQSITNIRNDTPHPATVVHMWCKISLVCLATTSHKRQKWCAILGLNQ